MPKIIYYPGVGRKCPLCNCYFGTNVDLEAHMEKHWRKTAPCAFSCKYCWARLPLWQHRLKNPNPIREAERLARSKKPKSIVASFTGDPYQPREWNKRLTKRVLENLLLRSKVKHTVMILTKNPRFTLERDYLLIRKKNVWLGTTLTSLHKIKDEPYAPSNYQRALALETAHQAGIRTWASIEPWIPGVTDPVEIIKATHEFVDWYVVGRLDYETQLGYPKIPKGWYQQKLQRVADLLESLSKPYHIKKCLKDGLNIGFSTYWRRKDFSS